MSDSKGRVLGLLFQHRATRHVVIWSTLIYLLIYLWAIGDLGFHGWRPTFALTWTREPWALLFQQRNLFYFEGIAILNLPLATYLFSPVNLVIGLALALLVGLNLALSYLGIKHPKACGGRPSHTLMASVPALLAGTTCSVPVILVLLGIQASAAALAFFSALVPIALVALLAALIFNIRKSDPEALQKVGGR